MRYLLDTNILSESVKKKPNISVTEFLRTSDPDELYISVLTMGEIRKGIERSAENPTRKQQLELWLENHLVTYFAGRILPINREVANRWGRIVTASNSHNVIDSLIAATAIRYDLTLVTRNTRDFNIFPVEILNPWLQTADS